MVQRGIAMMPTIKAIRQASPPTESVLIRTPASSISTHQAV